MTPQLDLSNWLNSADVQAALGISESTLDREVKAGRWQPRKRFRDGKKPERVFSPDEVYSRVQKPPTELVRQEPIPSIPSPVTELTEMPPVSWPAIIHLVESLIGTAVPESPKLWVKLKEASEITGLSVTGMRKLIDAGKMLAIKDRSIKVRREGLELLDVSALQMKPKRRKR